MRDLEHILAFAGGFARRDWQAFHAAERDRLGRELASLTVAESYAELCTLFAAWGGKPPPDLAPLEAEASAERICAIERRGAAFRCIQGARAGG